MDLVSSFSISMTLFIDSMVSHMNLIQHLYNNMPSYSQIVQAKEEEGFYYKFLYTLAEIEFYSMWLYFAAYCTWYVSPQYAQYDQQTLSDMCIAATEEEIIKNLTTF